MKVIAISGHAQNGKDTVASGIETLLNMQGRSTLVIHNADLLKYMCKSIFGWDGVKDEAGRKLLQTVGTDVIRKQNPDFWVSFICSVLKFFPDRWEYVLIPDTRFPNEITYLREHGLDVIHLRVEREGFNSALTDEQKKHPSETALDDVTADYYIKNDAGVHELFREVRLFVEENLYA